MTTTESSAQNLPLTAAAASRYQQLRGHLATLRLHTAAEQLPTVLDQASTEGLTVTAALERLLGLEVDATEAPGHDGHDCRVSVGHADHDGAQYPRHRTVGKDPRWINIYHPLDVLGSDFKAAVGESS